MKLLNFFAAALLALASAGASAQQQVVIVTSFTVAHSITLIASAFGLGPDALWLHLKPLSLNFWLHGIESARIHG